MLFARVYNAGEETIDHSKLPTGRKSSPVKNYALEDKYNR